MLGGAQSGYGGRVERRRAYRVAWQRRIQCRRVREGGRKEPLDAEAVDVSTLGALVATTRPLAPGEHLDLRLCSEDPALDVSAQGVVVRRGGRAPSGRFLSGVRFERLPGLKRAELGGFIAEQAVREGQPLAPVSVA